MKPFKSFLPSTPAAAVYAHLNPEPAPLQGPAPEPEPRTATLKEPKYGRRPRRLSDKQRKTFLGKAAERIGIEARDRGGLYIRRLDCIHASGCRTKQQRWDALHALAEPILAKLDIATMCLGWLDNDGAFRLNRQRGLAHDGELSETRVSRTLTDLATAGYVRRKVRRIFKNGRHWISRVTIHLRPRFFIDLGLGHLLAQARTTKKATRAAKLRTIAAAQDGANLQAIADKHQRQVSHRGAQGARQAKAAETEAQRVMHAKMAHNTEFARQQKLHPDMDAATLRALVDKTHPRH